MTTKNSFTKICNNKPNTNQKSKRSFTFTLRLVAILNNVLNVGLLRPFSMRMRLDVSKPQSYETSARVRFWRLRIWEIAFPNFIRPSASVIENPMINYAALFRIRVYQF